MSRALASGIGLAILLAGAPVRADCPTATSIDNSERRDLLVQGLPGAPDIAMTLIAQPGGFSYTRFSLGAQWRQPASSEPGYQMLLDEMQLGQLPEIVVDSGDVLVRRHLCQWQATCRPQTLRFSFDATADRFVQQPIEWSDWVFDPDTERWYHAPVTDAAALPVDQPTCPAEPLFEDSHER